MRYSKPHPIKPISFVLGMTLAARPTFAQAPVTENPEALKLPEVTVTESEDQSAAPYNPRTISLPKMTEPLLDTPQTATVVPKELLQDQGATTLREALDNVSGISISAGEGGAQGDNLTIRGFPARSDLYLDGMRDFGSYFRDPFNTEAIEVLKGPSSLTFGRGSTGGVINQASKTAEFKNGTEGTVILGSDLTRRATLDASKMTREKVAFRLNLMAHENNVAERDVTQSRRFGLAPSVVVKAGDSTRFKFNYFHQSEDNIPDYGIPFLLSKPAPVARSNYYGFQDTNFSRTDTDVLTFVTETAASDNVLLRNQLRYAIYGRNFQTTAPRISGSPTATTPLESIEVNRSQVAIRSTETILGNDFNVTTEIGSGSIRQTLITGIEATYETAKPVRKSFAGVPATDLLTPEPSEPFSGTGSITSRVKASLASVAGYVIDTLHLGKAFEVIAGLRWDYAHAEYSQALPSPSSLSRHDSVPSWRGGVVYKPRENGSIYVSYGTSFNPSAEQISLSAANAALEPEKNRSIELGTKWDLAHKQLTLTAAIFRAEKTNARVPDPADAGLNVLSGKHRVDGIELGATGRVSESWKIFAGYSYLDSELIETTRENELGARLPNTPEHTFSLWLTNELNERVTLGAGTLYVGKRYATTAPSATTGLKNEVEGYLKVDAMAKYEINEDVDVQLNVNNIANTEFIEGVYPGHVVPGAGRTILLTGLLKF